MKNLQNAKLIRTFNILFPAELWFLGFEIAKIE